MQINMMMKMNSFVLMFSENIETSASSVSREAQMASFTLPKTPQQYMLSIYAGLKHIRSILLQELPEEFSRPVGYCSCSLSKAEMAYDVTCYKGSTFKCVFLPLSSYVEDS